MFLKCSFLDKLLGYFDFIIRFLNYLSVFVFYIGLGPNALLLVMTTLIAIHRLHVFFIIHYRIIGVLMCMFTAPLQPIQYTI